MHVSCLLFLSCAAISRMPAPGSSDGSQPAALTNCHALLTDRTDCHPLVCEPFEYTPTTIAQIFPSMIMLLAFPCAHICLQQLLISRTAPVACSGACAIQGRAGTAGAANTDPASSGRGAWPLWQPGRSSKSVNQCVWCAEVHVSVVHNACTIERCAMAEKSGSGCQRATPSWYVCMAAGADLKVSAGPHSTCAKVVRAVHAAGGQGLSFNRRWCP